MQSGKRYYNNIWTGDVDERFSPGYFQAAGDPL
jgi:hypothetical protein